MVMALEKERERDIFRVWFATYPLYNCHRWTLENVQNDLFAWYCSQNTFCQWIGFRSGARLWEARVWWWCLGWNARPWQLGAEWATWSARIGQWNGKWNYQAKMLCWANLCRPCCEISTVETLLRYGFPIYTNVTWTIVYDRFCGRVDVWLPSVSWRFFGLDQSLKGIHRFHKRSRYRLLKTGLSDVRSTAVFCCGRWTTFFTAILLTSDIVVRIQQLGTCGVLPFRVSKVSRNTTCSDSPKKEQYLSCKGRISDLIDPLTFLLSFFFLSLHRFVPQSW